VTVRKSLERRWGKLDPAVVKSLTCDQGKNCFIESQERRLEGSKKEVSFSIRQ